jgi:hypothetical protein
VAAEAAVAGAEVARTLPRPSIYHLLFTIYIEIK